MSDPAMTFHKYATFFPLMEGEEFDALVSDIKAHGLLEPIITLEDAILDGRNRYRACQKAQVEPKFQAYQGNGALSYVISKNVVRRQLTESQRAILALEIEKELAKEAKEKLRLAGVQRGGLNKALGPFSGQVQVQDVQALSTEKAAKMLHVGGRTVKRAKRVAREAPELVPLIQRGAITVRDAEQQIRDNLAASAVKRNVERTDKKDRNEKPREVKEYLDAIRVFCEAVRTAKKVAAYGKFSPEAMRFTERQHDTIRELLTKVEEEFHAKAK